MSATNTFESDLLSCIFTNANIALLGDATGVRGSTTAGSLYISLHTADPGETGTQTTNEIAYTSYARVAVTRAGGSWTISGTSPTQVQNNAAITFPAGTGGSGTATHFGVGTDVSGAGKLLFKGTLTPNIVCGNGVTPQIPINGLTVTAD